jgi:transcriptional regulator with XRE-family HTH domain
MMDRQTALDTVAEALAGARARRGLSLEDAATAAQVDLERLASAESGEDALTDPELEALSLADGRLPSRISSARSCRWTFESSARTC